MSGFLHRIRAIAQFIGLLGVWFGAHLVPRDAHVWVFSSLGGEEFHGNSKYLFYHVAEEVDDVTAVWVGASDDVDRLTEAEYHAIDRHSIRGQVTVLRAGVVVNSHGMDVPWWCTGGATVVQLWHGNGIKDLGWGSEEFGSYSRARRLFYRFIYWNWDYAIAPADGGPTDRLCDAFRMDRDSILATGYPRIDFLVDGERPSGAHEALLRKGQPTITYLPTYRQAYGNDHGETTPLERLDIERLDRMLGASGAHLLVKLHPREELDIEIEPHDHITLLPQRREVMPLLAGTDILITDYSSTYVDFLLCDRPIVFFAPDRDAYLERQRLYFSYEAVTPGPIVETESELITSLETLLVGDDPWAHERAWARAHFHDHVDGSASERVADAIHNRVIDGEGVVDPSRSEGRIDGQPVRREA